MSSDNTNLDSSYFDADAYLTSLSETCSLQELMTHETTVSREIAELQSDMQSLVYENYNRFIKATDTVKEMKSDFQSIQNELSSLNDGMNSLIALSNSINNALCPNRQAKISRLLNTVNVLRRIAFVYDSPTKLRGYIESGDFANARRCYRLANAVLSRVGTLNSFSAVYKEWRTTVNEIKELLRDDKDHIELLVEMSEGDNSDLIKLFIEQIAQPAIDENIQKITEATDISDFAEVAQSAFFKCLNETFVRFRNLFGVGNISDILSVMSKAIAQFRELAFIKFTDAKLTDNAEVVKSLTRIICKLNEIPFVSSEEKIDFLSEVTSLRVIGIKNRIVLEFDDMLKSLEIAATSYFDKLIEKTSLFLVNNIKDALMSFIPFLSLCPTLQKSFICVDTIRHVFVYGILDYVIDLCEKPCHSAYLCLLLSKLSLSFHVTYFPHLCTLLEEHFFIENHSVTKSVDIMSTKLERAAKKAIESFVYYLGQQLSYETFQNVIDFDWLNIADGSVSKPRDFARSIIGKLSSIESSLMPLFDEGVKHERGSESSRFSFQMPSVALNIHRIFLDKMEFFSTNQIQFTRICIMTAFVKIVLKAFIEAIRLCTFSQGAFHQIQVDVCYFQSRLWRFVSDDRVVNVLLEECLVSAMNRCLNPVPLDQSIVERLSEENS